MLVMGEVEGGVWDRLEGEGGTGGGDKGREWSSTMIHHHGAQHTPFLGNMPAPTPPPHLQQFGGVPKSDKVTLALFSCAAAPCHSNQTVSSTSASQQHTNR